ncbi:MAG: DUF655 domain-containing protein [Slackia sp.]
MVAAHVAVHVSGAVASPGVYELEEGSRVRDAVEVRAVLPEASRNLSTLRAKCRRASRYHPHRRRIQASPSSFSSSGSSDADASGSSGSGGLVNINTAGLEALDSLPGVGPATAQAILDEREANGPFTSIEDIQRVSGIGEKKYEKLKGSICV